MGPVLHGRAPASTHASGSGSKNSGHEKSHPPLAGNPISRPKPCSLLPHPTLARSPGCFPLLTMENTSQCTLYLRVPPRMATGSSGHKRLSILRAKNTYSLCTPATIRQENFESNFYKAFVDGILSPKAVLFLYPLISSPKRPFLEAVSKLAFDVILMELIKKIKHIP